MAVPSFQRTAVAWLCAASLLTGCKLLGGGDSGSTKTSGGSPDAPSGSGSGSSADTASAAVRDVAFAVTVTITPDGEEPEITYENVHEIFVNRCLSCHAAGATLDLSAWPFKGRFATPGATVAEILARTSDEKNPMPPKPNTALTAAETLALKVWKDQGLKASADAPKNPAAQKFADGLVVVVAWHAIKDGDAAKDQVVPLPWNGLGKFSGALARLTVGDAIAVKVSVRGEDGKEIATKKIDAFAVTEAGDLGFALTVEEAAVKTHAIDRTAPVPGRGGTVSADAVEVNAVTLGWERATDDLSASDDLAYAVYIGDDAASVSSFATAEKKGLQALDFKKALGGAKISGLLPGKSYYFAVFVRDSQGNTSVYTVLQQATAADKTPPNVATPALAVSAIHEGDVVLSWFAANDELTLANKLVYRVVAANVNTIDDADGAAANGVVVGTTAPGITTLKVAGLVPETAYFFNVFAVDESGNVAPYQTIKVTSAVAAGDVDVVTQGKECAARLGEIKPFNCLDGALLPIEVNHQAIKPGLSAPEAAGYHFGTAANDQQVCDRPALLGLGSQGHCIPYARLARLKSYRADGVEMTAVDTVITCRRYVGRVGKSTWQGSVYDGADFPGFEDVAMIQHSRATGETCFFQMLMPNAATVDARRVPPPSEAALPPGTPAYALSAANFWLKPADAAAKNCNRCHDSDPWMHSPYVDQVKADDGAPLVPSGAFGPANNGKYSVIGRRGFNNWQKTNSVTSIVTTDTSGQSCGSCHNIGNLNTCLQWAPQASGTILAPNASATAVNEFSYRHWMPPLTAAVTDVPAWTAGGFKRAAERQAACCAHPASAECKAAPVITAPPPYLAP